MLLQSKLTRNALMYFPSLKYRLICILYKYILKYMISFCYIFIILSSGNNTSMGEYKTNRSASHFNYQSHTYNNKSDHVFTYLEQARPLQPHNKKHLVTRFDFVDKRASDQTQDCFIVQQQEVQQLRKSVGCVPANKKNAEYQAEQNIEDCDQAGNESMWRLEEIPSDRNSSIHQLGTSLKQLFAQPVYQSYKELMLEDNATFCTVFAGFDLTRNSLSSCSAENSDFSLLKFGSRFQSGNLGVVSVDSSDPSHYLLALQRDTNSKATCQWYYFYVQNRQQLGEYTFSIVNLTKSYSAYQNGMRPCVFSVKDSIKHQTGWLRGGKNIHYRQNSLSYRNHRKYHTLAFSYEFVNAHDRVYFAYSFPYTFSRLQNFLYEKQIANPTIMKSRVLTKTIGGNCVELITISTAEKDQDEINKPAEDRGSKKDVILITARVHPGETVGSYVCEGLINFLLSNKQEVQELRKHYNIKIVPFLNPDGVIHGNYRTSLAGADLNRQWKRPGKQQHPEIFALKKYLSENEGRVTLFIDLHGHSKKRSSFMYGCLDRDNPYLCKQFPFILSKFGYEFSYCNCNFSTPLSKQGTSRITVWKQFKVRYSYTMEVSFCGSTKCKLQYSPRNYLRMGWKLGHGISLYFHGKKSPNTKLISSLHHLYNIPQDLKHGQEDSDGSESGEEELYASQFLTAKSQHAISNRSMGRDPKQFFRRNLVGDLRSPSVIQAGNFDSKNHKNLSPSSLYFKARKELNSKINIQKVDIGSQSQLFQMNMCNYAPKIINLKPYNSRKAYQPYSSSKRQCDERIIAKGPHQTQSGTFYLPKVLQNQQKKQYRYKNQDLSLNLFLNQSSQSPNQARSQMKVTLMSFKNQMSPTRKSAQTKLEKYQQAADTEKISSQAIVLKARSRAIIPETSYGLFGRKNESYQAQ